MDKIASIIESLLNGINNGLDNTQFENKCDFIGEMNFLAWVDEDKKLNFNNVYECVKEFNEKTKYVYGVTFRRSVGGKILLKFCLAYDRSNLT